MAIHQFLHIAGVETTGKRTVGDGLVPFRRALTVALRECLRILVTTD